MFFLLLRSFKIRVKDFSTLIGSVTWIGKGDGVITGTGTGNGSSSGSNSREPLF